MWGNAPFPCDAITFARLAAELAEIEAMALPPSAAPLPQSDAQELTAADESVSAFDLPEEPEDEPALPGFAEPALAAT